MNFSWLTDLWNQSPRGLKKVLAATLVAIGVAIGMVIGMNVWAAGWIQERLGLVATKEDLLQQTDTINATNMEVASQVTDALAAYDDSLKSYLKAERQLAVDTTLKPLLKMLFALQESTNEVRSMQQSTNSRVSQLPAAYEGSLRQIIEEKPPSRTEAMLEEMLVRMAKLEQQQLTTDSLSKKRLSKGRF